MLNTKIKDAVQAVAYAIPMETMGDRIKALRQARRLTQQQLADACGATKSAVSQWEDGSTSNIKLQLFMRLCDVLGTDPHYLIWGPDREEPPAPKGPDTSASGRFRRPKFGPR